MTQMEIPKITKASLNKEQKNDILMMMNTDGWKLLVGMLDKIEHELVNVLIKPNEKSNQIRWTDYDIYRILLPIIWQIKKEPYNWTRDSLTQNIEDYIEQSMSAQ